jgi:cation transport regulator ChaC
MTNDGAPTVWVFFYGSYMNFDVLAEVGLKPRAWETASLPGFDIVIGPRANLVRAERAVVWGVNATATHAELDRLYSAHAKALLGETYLPEAVLTHTASGAVRPAMTYICPHMEPRPADPAYVERIAAPARQNGFPAWYVARIESFSSKR